MHSAILSPKNPVRISAGVRAAIFHGTGLAQPLRFRQRGATLIVALVFLFILTILGIASMGSNTLEQRMAANTKDQNVAFQAAESALRVGELQIASYANLPVASSTGSTGVWTFGSPNVTNLQWWASNGTSPTTMIPNVVSEKYVIEDRMKVPDSLNTGIGAPKGRRYYRVTAYATGQLLSSNNYAQQVLQSNYVIRY